MECGKLDYAKQAAGIVIDQLGLTDLLAVVEYNDRICALWPSSPVEAPTLL